MWSQSIFFCAKRNPAVQTTLRMLAVGVLACATSNILHQVGHFGKGYPKPESLSSRGNALCAGFIALTEVTADIVQHTGRTVRRPRPAYLTSVPDKVQVQRVVPLRRYQRFPDRFDLPLSLFCACQADPPGNPPDMGVYGKGGLAKTE